MKNSLILIVVMAMVLSACGAPAASEVPAQPTVAETPAQPTSTVAPTQAPRPFESLVASMAYAGNIHTAAFSPDGKLVLTSGCSQVLPSNTSRCLQTEARVWEATTGKGIAQMANAGGGDFSAAAFSPDGTLVVSGGCDDDAANRRDYWCDNGTAKVWEIATGQELARTTHKGYVHLVAFSPNGKVFSAGYDDRNYLWSVDNATSPIHLEPDYVLDTVSFSPDGKFVTIPHGLIRVWSEDGNLLSQYKHEGGWNAEFSPDGKYIVSGGCDKQAPQSQNYVCIEGVARVWSVETGKEIAHKSHGASIYTSEFSSNGKYIITGGCDNQSFPSNDCTKGFAQVWLPETGDVVSEVAFNNYVNTVTISPDGKYAAAGSTVDNKVIVWLTETGEEVARIDYATGVNALDFSPDGKLFLTAGCEQGIYLSGESCYARVWLVGELPANSNNAGSSQPATATTEFKSGNGTMEVKLKFVNKTDQVVKLYWMNFDGVEEPFGEIEPGASFEQATFETHAWRLKDAEGKMLFEYTATTQPIQEITINTDLTVTVK